MPDATAPVGIDLAATQRRTVRVLAAGQVLTGVAFGASIPNQGAMTNPGNPASSMVGTSGSEASRFELVTASARSAPALTCGRMEGVLSKKRSICPPRRSVIAGAEPL